MRGLPELIRRWRTHEAHTLGADHDVGYGGEPFEYVVSRDAPEEVTSKLPARILGKGSDKAMHVLKIEYPVADYDSWKEHFDRDRLDREGSGVRRHRILRPIGHPDYVMIDVGFDSASEAEAYLTALRRHVYSERHPASVWSNPHTRIVEVVEDKEY